MWASRCVSGFIWRVPTLVLLLAVAVGCEGKSPDTDRDALYRNSVALKADSAATRAFFETMLADSLQQERLARAILANEGMRRTMVRALLADSLANLRGAGLPTSTVPAAGTQPGPSGALAPTPRPGAPAPATGP
jgi:hypothetical protein